MLRTLKIISSASLLLASVVIAAANVNRPITALSVLLAVLGFHWLAISANGVFTGYLETRNKDLESVTHTLKTLFDSARRSIQIVSGRLNPIAYCANDVFEALAGAVRRGVKGDIIVGEPELGIAAILRNIDEEEKRSLFANWVKQGKITIKHASNPPVQHFIVVDGEHVRIEDPQRRLWGLRISHSHRAHTVFFAEDSGRWVKRFKKLDESAIPLSTAA